MTNFNNWFEITSLKMTRTNTYIQSRNTLQAYNILDTLPEKEYDNITELIAHICNVPISFVSLLDTERQFFKSGYGIDINETPIEHSFCKHAVKSPDDIFIVLNARKDNRFKNNPLVTGKPNFVFYAGVPLITPRGNPIGTLCVVDNKEKKINDYQKRALKNLANQVVALLELRKSRLDIKNSKLKYETLFRSSPQAVLLFSYEENKFLDANAAAKKLFGFSANEIKKMGLAEIGLQKLSQETLDLSNLKQKELHTLLVGDQKVVKVEITTSELLLEGKKCCLMVCNDRTEQIIQENRKKIVDAISNIFNREKTIKGCLKKLLQYIYKFGEFNLTEIWLTDSTSSKLLQAATFTNTTVGYTFYAKSQSVKSFFRGEGLPGTVWETKKSNIWDNVDKKNLFIRKKAAQKSGLTKVFGIPLFHNKEIIGVLVCGIEKSNRLYPYFTDVLKQMGNFIGSEIIRKQSEIELNSFFQHSPDILAIAGPEGHFRKVNPAFTKLMGYTDIELTSQPFENFVFSTDTKDTLKEFKETISGERHSNNFVNRYITKSGDIKWIAWSSSDLIREEGLAFCYGRDITEQKNMQNLLDNANKLARIGSWEVDLVKNTVYWSDITRQIHEVDDDFVPDTTNTIGFYKENYQKTINKIFTDCIENKKPIDFEMPIITAKKREVWIRIIGRAEYENNKCVKLSGSFQDINQKKKAEIELKTILNEKNTILESIKDGFFTIDKNWMITYWNREAEKILRVKRQNILGENLWEVFSDSEELSFFKKYQKAMKSGVVVHFEEFYPSLNIWMELSIYPSKKGLSTYFKNITTRKIAEEKLRQSNERFEIAAEATNDAIWDWDFKKKTLSWGKGFETLFGYKIEDHKPNLKTWTDRIHPEDLERVIGNLNEVIQLNDEKHFEAEYRFKKSNESYAYVVDRGIVVRNKSNEVERMIGAMTDITFRKNYEKKLRSLNVKLRNHSRELQISNAELEQFAYIASHDLQEPLRMVTRFLSQLEKKYNDKLDEKARQYIFFAVDGAKRMRQIILDLLHFSRVGRLNEIKEAVNINKIIDDYSTLRKELIGQKAVTLIKNKLPEIYSFKTPVTQIFHNLIDNSIKYSREKVKPIIEINSKEEDEYWEFSVKDNGIGIEEEYFEKIFIIFQRLHDKEEYSGTGMGLAIVKKIIDNMGGKIRVESTPNEGSTFYFTLKK
ncbi:MAG: PAS domain S-box protein [Chitinophagaceae bacterium]|nr:MAG: PAS domain S-box protein [Chitinophagaceae bacterium]